MKNNEVTFTKEEVQKIMVEAFIKGEDWGATYGGWYTPSEKDKSNRAAKECEELYKKALIAKL
jgi:hypothetical protein